MPEVQELLDRLGIGGPLRVEHIKAGSFLVFSPHKKEPLDHIVLERYEGDYDHSGSYDDYRNLFPSTIQITLKPEQEAARQDAIESDRIAAKKRQNELNKDPYAREAVNSDQANRRSRQFPDKKPELRLLPIGPGQNRRDGAKVEVVRVEKSEGKYPSIVCRFTGGPAEFFPGGNNDIRDTVPVHQIESIEGISPPQYFRDHLFVIYATPDNLRNLKQ